MLGYQRKEKSHNSRFIRIALFPKAFGSRTLPLQEHLGYIFRAIFDKANDPNPPPKLTPETVVKLTLSVETSVASLAGLDFPGGAANVRGADALLPSGQWAHSLRGQGTARERQL